MTQRTSPGRIARRWRRGVLSALICAVGLLVAAPGAFAYIYWVSNVKGQGQVFRANIDGTGKRRLPVPGAQVMVAAGSYVYSVTARGIGRWDADGSHSKPALVRVSSNGVASDFLTVAGSYVYWSSIDPSDNEYAISRANLDGTGVRVGYIKSGLYPMTGDQLAVEGGYIYWFDQPTPDTVAIGRARIDGSDVTESFISFPSDASTEPYLAAEGPYLYFNTNGSGFEDEIGRARIDGSGAPQLDYIDLGLRDKTYAGFAGMVVAGSHIYFAYSADNGGIGRVNLDGSGLQRQLIPVKGCLSCFPVIGGITALAVGSAASGPSSPGCTVPKLTGLLLAKARRALGQRGCRLGPITRTGVAGTPGQVLSQRPKAGSHLAAGGPVAVTISKR